MHGLFAASPSSWPVLMAIASFRHSNVIAFVHFSSQGSIVLVVLFSGGTMLLGDGVSFVPRNSNYSRNVLVRPDSDPAVLNIYVLLLYLSSFFHIKGSTFLVPTGFSGKPT